MFQDADNLYDDISYLCDFLDENCVFETLELLICYGTWIQQTWREHALLR